MATRQEQELTNCAAFRADKDIVKLYRAAYPGGKRVPITNPALKKLAEYVMQKYYGASSSTYKVVVTPYNPHSMACLTCEPGRKEIPPTEISEDTFDSPAYLATTIGHELIHQIQCRREYTTRFDGRVEVNEAVKIFWELEAHSWELGKTTIEYSLDGKVKFSKNQFLGCLTKDDRAKADQGFAERERDVKAAIQKVAAASKEFRKEHMLSALERWLKVDDIWTKTDWFPKNSALLPAAAD